MPSRDAWLKVAQDRFDEGEQLLQEARAARWHLFRRVKLYRQATRMFRRSRYCSYQAGLN